MLKAVILFSASNDNEKFRLVCPDSLIAEGYSQSSTKIKYAIQFSIALY